MGNFFATWIYLDPLGRYNIIKWLTARNSQELHTTFTRLVMCSSLKMETNLIWMISVPNESSDLYIAFLALDGISHVLDRR